MIWTTPPEYQGQMVQRAYACDSCFIYLEMTDRSDRSTRYWRADYEAMSGDFEPWNKTPTIDDTQWESLPEKPKGLDI